MSHLHDVQVACLTCGRPAKREIELAWGRDDPWHRYFVGDPIRWKARANRPAEAALDPVWVHGIGRPACHGGEDFLIEIRGNRIRAVRAIPPVPPRLQSFGLAREAQEPFHCLTPGRWPHPLAADDHAWLARLVATLA